MKALKQFGIIPIDYATLHHVFAHYKSPKDKIADLAVRGTLIRLKKGLFVVSPEINGSELSKELIANHLYGPSYISLESALSHYGMIPERVHTTRSVTSKRAKQFSTSLGLFEYVSVPETYYSIGVRHEIINEQYAWMIATPEKALCDMIVATRGLRLQSVKAMSDYLLKDLRIDFSVLETYNIGIVKQCLINGRKKTELTQLLKFLMQ